MAVSRCAGTRLVWGLAICAGAALSSASEGGSVLYVDDDAPPGGDGASWGTAYRFLQDALADASGGGITEIRVAQGTYLPDHDDANPNGTGEREATFLLIDGVALMGGYARFSGPNPDVRDIDLYVTILSGDLLGNDGPDFANYDENSHIIVIASGSDETTTLDGFTITGAAMGGMRNASTRARVANCTFTANTALIGGGMHNFGGMPTVTNCTFSANRAIQGGGMYNVYWTTPIVTNCTFIDNTAGYGGGLFNGKHTSASVSNCTFSRNSAGSGGGICNYDSKPTFANCTVNGNSAGDPMSSLSSPGQFGGGVYNIEAVDLIFANCIVYGNTGGQIDDTGSAQKVRYSNVEGGYPGIGNIDADPLFVDPDSADYRLSFGSPCLDAGNNWGVPSDSADLDDDGNTSELAPFDLDGNPRFVHAPIAPHPGCGVPVIVDMGAYEFQEGTAVQPVHGDLDGNGTVGMVDVLILLASWGLCNEGCCLADLDIDGSVGILDLLVLLANWG